MKLTNDFSLEEFRVSKEYPFLAAKIDFTKEDIVKLFYLSTILQRERNIYGRIDILSGKRSDELNEKVEGAKNSDHLFKGYSCASDFAPKVFLEQLFPIYKDIFDEYHYSIGEAIFYFDKVWQPRFIHLSLPTEKHLSEFYYDYNYGEEFKTLKGLPAQVYAKIFI